VPIRIRSKNSVVKDKAPLPADLEIGELALNAHQDSPAIYLKDAAGAVRKIAGAGAVGNTDATTTAKGVVQLATHAETTTGTNDTHAVTPAGLKVELNKKANLASPALTGTPTAPTAAAGTNTTQLATTAFVGAAVTAGTPAATTAASGLVRLADAAAVTAGTAGRVVDAAQLKAAVAAEDLWDRTGTEISPKNAGDSVFTSGSVKVGGTTAAPNIQLRADAHFTAGPAGKFQFGKAGEAGIGLEATNQILYGTYGSGGHLTITAQDTTATAGGAGIVLGGSTRGDSDKSKIKFQTIGNPGTPGAGGHQVEINATGDVLIGGTLPASPAIKLAANGTVSATRFSDDTHFSIYYAAPPAPENRTILETTTGLDVQNVGGAKAGVSLVTGATAWTPLTSESRLKDIQSGVDTDQCWTLIRDIELKRYYYKDQDDKSGVSYMGPMADWLGVQDPELLIDTGRSDDDGPIHTYNQGLLDMKALAALSAALKRIEDLETRLAALEPAPPQKQTDPGAK
jgi:hypothetical protein